MVFRDFKENNSFLLQIFEIRIKKILDLWSIKIQIRNTEKKIINHLQYIPFQVLKSRILMRV